MFQVFTCFVLCLQNSVYWQLNFIVLLNLSLRKIKQTHVKTANIAIYKISLYRLFEVLFYVMRIPKNICTTSMKLLLAAILLHFQRLGCVLRRKSFCRLWKLFVLLHLFSFHHFSRSNLVIIIITIIIIIYFIVNEKSNFLSHIYKNRLFVPQLIQELKLKTNRKTLFPSLLETPKKLNFPDVFKG